jgi:hypothetical protein
MKNETFPVQENQTQILILIGQGNWLLFPKDDGFTLPKTKYFLTKKELPKEIFDFLFGDKP